MPATTTLISTSQTSSSSQPSTSPSAATTTMLASTATEGTSEVPTSTVPSSSGPTVSTLPEVASTTPLSTSQTQATSSIAATSVTSMATATSATEAATTSSQATTGSAQAPSGTSTPQAHASSAPSSTSSTASTSTDTSQAGSTSQVQTPSTSHIATIIASTTPTATSQQITTTEYASTSESQPESTTAAHPTQPTTTNPGPASSQLSQATTSVQEPSTSTSEDSSTSVAQPTLTTATLHTTTVPHTSEMPNTSDAASSTSTNLTEGITTTVVHISMTETNTPTVETAQEPSTTTETPDLATTSSTLPPTTANYIASTSALSTTAIATTTLTPYPTTSIAAPIACFLHFQSGRATTKSEVIVQSAQSITFALPPTNFTIDSAYELKWSVSNTGRPEPKGFIALIAPSATCLIGSTAITCQLPSAPTYDIESTETVVLQINANAVTPRVAGCNPNFMLTVGVLTIQLSSEAGSSMRGSWASSSAFASSAASAAVLIISDGTSIEVQAMVVMLLGVCSEDAESVRFVKYFVSPFISISTQWAVVGNFLLALVVGLVHLLIVFVNAKSSPGEALMEVGGRLWFPSFPLAIATVLYMGVVSSTFDLFHGPSDGTDYLALALGIVYLVAVPVLCLLVLLRIRPTYLPHTGYQSRGAPSSWALPGGYYTPEVQRQASLWVFGFADFGCRWFAFLPHVVTFVVSLLVTALPSSVDCTVRYVVLAIVFAIVAVAVAVLRPYRALLTSALTVLAFVSLCLLCVAQIVVLNAESTSSATRLKDAAIILIIIFVSIRAVHTLLVLMIEVIPSKESPAADEKYAEVDESDAFYIGKGFPEVDAPAWADIEKDSSGAKAGPSESQSTGTGAHTTPEKDSSRGADPIPSNAMSVEKVGQVGQAEVPSDTPEAAPEPAPAMGDPYATSSDEEPVPTDHGVDVHALPRPAEEAAPSALDAYAVRNNITAGDYIVTDGYETKSHASSMDSEGELY
eukprot:GILK01012482.1.p1 GENE.GILK01012482.1~~GILK01012482.1.p1  ORF type:complete len:1008 (+),score=46.16 GILK01012482.1:91-3024(+)